MHVHNVNSERDHQVCHRIVMHHFVALFVLKLWLPVDTGSGTRTRASAKLLFTPQYTIAKEGGHECESSGSSARTTNHYTVALKMQIRIKSIFHLMHCITRVLCHVYRNPRVRSLQIFCTTDLFHLHTCHFTVIWLQLLIEMQTILCSCTHEEC